MAEDMYRALWSFLIGVIVTVVVSLLTKPRTREELVGLVRGCTELPAIHYSLLQRPAFWAAIVGVACVILNVIFW
jgi:SSS family solute:Na+ symporter